MMIRYGKDEVLQAADNGHITGKSAQANLLPVLEPRIVPQDIMTRRHIYYSWDTNWTGGAIRPEGLTTP